MGITETRSLLTTPLKSIFKSLLIMSEVKMGSAPFDPRFPNQNQTRNCWQNYVDYYRCTNLKGEDYAPCQFFWKNFNTLCPMAWVEKWNDQREAGTFPVKLD